MPHGKKLQVVDYSEEAETLHSQLGAQQELARPRVSPIQKPFTNLDVRLIKRGHVISTAPDGPGHSYWEEQQGKHIRHDKRWFLYVTDIGHGDDGKKEVDGIWFYEPADTLCGIMKYPWANELFLSTHCSCRSRNKVTEDEVLAIHSVKFGGSPTTESEFFCRSTYNPEQRMWLALRDSHFQCKHARSARKNFQVGCTYLVYFDKVNRVSEPCELTKLPFGHFGGYTMRRLLRHQELDPVTAVAPNQLIYTDIFQEVPERSILTECKVRCFPDGEQIYQPYDRDGTACCFFVTHQMTTTDDHVEILPLQQHPPSLRQAQSIDELELPRLSGLDLFCGGGNFGRGLEEAGSVDIRWAVDINEKAMRTYMANTRPEIGLTPYIGSIDEFNRQALAGNFDAKVPPIGAVDFVSGGSPCQGFSILTNDKATDAQRKNQSMVAAFATAVDIYRPKFGILENVPGIIETRAGKSNDVCSQMICALVGMGYQLSMFYLDASSCGAPQKRGRIFVTFAAPGYILPSPPVHSHSLPPGTKNRGYGHLPTGEPMAFREVGGIYPFRYVSAQEACKGLPVIEDAKVDICVSFPDHRIAMAVTQVQRSRISRIPTKPHGMNFSKAFYGYEYFDPTTGENVSIAPVIPRCDGHIFHEGLGVNEDETAQEEDLPMGARKVSNSWGRIYPDGLMETIVTTCAPQDAMVGRALHWQEDRPISVMEARRAQGFRDEEVLLGDPADQYKVIGNSVARQVAVALGVTFADAYVLGLQGKEEGNQRKRKYED